MGMFSSIARATGWNMAGNVIPLLVAAAATPWLIRALGLERFGLLSLIWALIGYFSLFDFGLGRAITQLAARHHESPRDVAAICSTGIVMTAVIGLIGGMLTALAAASGLSGALGVGPELRPELTLALFAVAAGVPIAACTAGARGILEGKQRFRLLNLIRIPAGTLLFLVPCAVAAFSPRLDHITIALVCARFLVLVVHLRACTSGTHLALAFASRAWAARLARFGGWLTLSNLVGPLITYSDRVIVGLAASATALAYYAPSLEAVSRMLVLTLALTSALLPALAGATAQPAQFEALQRRAFRLTAGGAALFCVPGMLLAQPLLALWLGSDFAQQAAAPTQVLFIGLLLQSMAQIPMTALYSRGQSRPLALFNLAQLPCYLLVLYQATTVFGLQGAAIAWSARAGIECLVLLALEKRLRPCSSSPY